MALRRDRSYSTRLWAQRAVIVVPLLLPPTSAMCPLATVLPARYIVMYRYVMYVGVSQKVDNGRTVRA